MVEVVEVTMRDLVLNRVRVLVRSVVVLGFSAGLPGGKQVDDNDQLFDRNSSPSC
jgi:hypothetical protein